MGHELDLDCGTWEAAAHDVKDLEEGLKTLFNQCSDLRMEKEDPSDEAFVGYAGDRMHWAGVPEDLRDRAKAWMRRSFKGEI